MILILTTANKCLSSIENSEYKIIYKYTDKNTENSN